MKIQIKGGGGIGYSVFHCFTCHGRFQKTTHIKLTFNMSITETSKFQLKLVLNIKYEIWNSCIWSFWSHLLCLLKLSGYTGSTDHVALHSPGNQFWGVPGGMSLLVCPTGLPYWSALLVCPCPWNHINLNGQVNPDPLSRYSFTSISGPHKYPHSFMFVGRYADE